MLTETEAVFLRILELMLSMLAEVDSLRLLTRRAISSAVISIGSMYAMSSSGTYGTLEWSSRGKTDEKNALNADVQ